MHFEHAALTEPLACVVRGLEESGAVRGRRMAVIGAGPIGLMFMHAASWRGSRDCGGEAQGPGGDGEAFGARQVVRLAEGVDVVAAVRD